MSTTSLDPTHDGLSTKFSEPAYARGFSSLDLQFGTYMLQITRGLSNRRACHGNIRSESIITNVKTGDQNHGKKFTKRENVINLDNARRQFMSNVFLCCKGQLYGVT